MAERDPDPITAVGSPAPQLHTSLAIQVILALLTVVTTSSFYYLDALWFGVIRGMKQHLVPFSWDVIVAGLWYSVPVMSIIAAHELGHYFASRRYGVRASLPFFLPLPLPPAGTAGAFIRLRSSIPSRRALFDIAASGPIAGFVAALPFLFIGLSVSDISTLHSTVVFQESLLFKGAVRLVHGSLSTNQVVVVHPMAFAAWFGLLLTSVSLLPFSLFDGGRIASAILGRKGRTLSIVTAGIVLIMAFRDLFWIGIAVVMLVMSIVSGLGHPDMMDTSSLGRGRALISLVLIVVLVICLTPRPILPGVIVLRR